MRFSRVALAWSLIPAIVLLSSPAASTAPSDDRAIAHVLNRVTFGPRPGDVEKVREIGIDAYIDRQLHPERIDDSRVDARLSSLASLTMTSQQIAQTYVRPFLEARRRVQQEMVAAMQPDDPRMQSPELQAARQKQNELLFELTEQKLARAVESERQLQEVLVDFWFNHFNVFVGKNQVRPHLTSYERDVIRPHVFGKFRDLLGATAHAPAMLVYLDNAQSVDPKAAERMDNGRRRADQARPLPANRRARGLNENYARELLELHTLGVDGGYTQKDVQEVARAFTGWTVSPPEQGMEFRFNARMHDNEQKVVLGHTLKAGQGMRDGEQVLDILARHPSTAAFIATKLARRFIADNPPQSVIDRAAATFKRTDGDLREVTRTILTSPEFRAPDAYRAKVKTPLEFVASALRVTGAQVNNSRPLVQALRDMGMPLYGCQPPTGYPDRADVWVNTGALLNRMNFAVALIDGKLRGTRLMDRSVTALSLGSAEFQRR